ncbi:ELKS/RAB6-interacting/CAST family member 2 [Nothobranchius furzeri]|uniref:ELKS/RAB6-interacting/CAST family member 2 n=1 Tax=Nothobranchius furzeri TaxID=105023 RepID=A0A9D2Z1C9_NOTFU|nr:ELKS/RAB6-interacting/CAST family member 2 [Nothobranchius furzeri]
MPLNVRPKPSHSKLSAVAKSSGHSEGSTSHSRFSRSPKQGKGKQAVSSAPGSRSGLEPGCVSGGGPAPVSKLAGNQGSVSKPGSKTQAGKAAADKRSSHCSATAPGGKTLSMENIQSLSAAYATSGTMYPSERESLESSSGFPKGTMTLGRSTNHSSYTGRTAAMRSSPNITSSGLHHLSDACGDQSGLSAGTSSLRLQTGSCTRTLDSARRGDISTCDLQAQLKDLQRENDSLRRELEGGREKKTGYGTNNVDFWCPDVKRDRGSRREDGVRTSSHMKDQYKANHEDLQQLPLTVQELQEELRAHREMNNRVRQQRQQGNSCREHHTDHASEENFFRLQSEHERQAKELTQLRKTMEEMEVRIDSQKQTLGARDESIQRLLEMLQGQSQEHCGRGQKTGIITMAAQEAEAQLENMHLREELHRRNQLQAEPAKTRALQTVIDMKDTKISSLERNIRDLEDEVQMLKTSGLLHPDYRQEELKQVEVYKSHSKFMKTKIEQLKQELNKKESEMLALQTKLDALTNQNSDSKQHVEVLKESLAAKDQRANTLQTEVDALRVRLEEKEQILTKKTKQMQDLSDEKSMLTGEIRDMKDMLDVKERKVNVLQKKIENLLEQLKDKDKQLAGLRERVQGLQTDSSNTDTALATLEEALSEKERVIENLREQREREDRLRLDELEQMRKENQELKDKLPPLQPQKMSQSRVTNPTSTQNQKPDGEVLTKLDGFPTISPTTQKTEEAVRMCPDIAERLRLLEQEVARYRDESWKSQAEVERLKGALNDAEIDKSCKEKKMTDLERQIKSPNIQKQLVQSEIRKDAVPDGHPHSLSQLEELMGALEKTRQELDATKVRLSSTQKCLHERDGHLNHLQQERRKQLEEILEMKQQALLAAISEKDANIALLELSSSKRKKAQEEVLALKREKDRLMHQLKQQTQSRMKLIAGNYEEDYIHPQHHPHHLHHMHQINVYHRSLPRVVPHSNHRPPMDQDDEEGIWA